MVLDELTLFKQYALSQEVGTCRYFKLEIKTHIKICDLAIMEKICNMFKVYEIIFFVSLHISKLFAL
jgi:hypothetical protein